MSDDLAATLLLQLRVRAFAPTDVLAAAAGEPDERVAPALAEYESHRWVQRRDGRIVGWTLTAAGRRRGQELLAAEVDAAGARDAVTDAYLDFLPLNAELLSICTDWQVVVVDGEHVPNDHADAERDAAVLRRLIELHPAAVELLDRLTGVLDRFAGYVPRLQEAHDHVVAGRTEWLARASGSSYHGIWFELHEHLLTVLGHDREHEPVPAYTPTTIGSSEGSTTNGDTP
ncbi:hypothetical protein [Dermatobacter hominis]|uniref:hypothetical protein n=1 Tax=Dermatobacter hominis TaxID=2884263 RepID=UPI001D12FDCA|nr:hypothetical protein [Dermatobacter hominis]UDY36835.1 hypothetical protein LH044_04685 [Dermatobacter hominis]